MWQFAVDEQHGFNDVFTTEFYSFDPKVRYTFWVFLTLAILRPLENYGTDQLVVQRLLSSKSYADAKRGDFSFSGIKTAVLYHARRVGLQPAESPDTASLEIRDLVASFQRAVVAALVRRMREVALERRPRTLLLSGGVAANRVLRREAARAAAELGLELFMPPIALSTDNAAMIAAAGFVNMGKGLRAGLDLDADPHLPLA
jgi:N6-L-threonylcarbamoyladenine synthase